MKEPVRSAVQDTPQGTTGKFLHATLHGAAYRTRFLDCREVVAIRFKSLSALDDRRATTTTTSDNDNDERPTTTRTIRLSRDGDETTRSRTDTGSGGAGSRETRLGFGGAAGRGLRAARRWQRAAATSRLIQLLHLALRVPVFRQFLGGLKPSNGVGSSCEVFRAVACSCASTFPAA